MQRGGGEGVSRAQNTQWNPIAETTVKALEMTETKSHIVLTTVSFTRTLREGVAHSILKETTLEGDAKEAQRTCK